MKKITAFLLIALLAPAVLSAKAKVYESEKVENHSFPASSSHTLTVDNKYGIILIEQWDKNEVQATVTILGKSSRSQEVADGLVNRIKINASTNGNNIIFRTEFVTNITVKSNGSESQSNEINYLIKVPRNIAFNLTNKYGNITIDESGSSTVVDVKYGDFRCGKMTGKSSSLTIGYGNANIQDASSLIADLKYSNLSLDNAGVLNLTTKYSNIKTETIGNLTAYSGYDSYKIENVNNTNVDAKYTHIKIGKVNESCSLMNKYGSIKIDEVDAKARSLSFELGYTSLAINISPKISYELDAYTKYGKIVLPDGITTNIKHRDTENSSTTIKGTIGNGTPGLKVKATNSYDDIKLTAK